MYDILAQPRSAKRGTMGITHHNCFVPGQLVPRNRRSSVMVVAIGPGRGPRPRSRSKSRCIDLNHELVYVYRGLGLGPLHQLHRGRSHGLVRYNDCPHGELSPRSFVALAETLQGWKADI
jgi:hypothetical protein